MNFPYMKYEKSKIWSVVNNALEDLVDNKDIIEKTSRKYLIGYILQALEKSNCISFQNIDAKQEKSL